MTQQPFEPEPQASRPGSDPYTAESAPPPVAQPPQAVVQPPHQQPMQVQARSPLLYVLIDFLITGLGLIVQGRVPLGVAFLLTTIFCFALSWIPFLGIALIILVMLPVSIISMVMAYNTAKQWNRQHGIIT